MLNIAAASFALYKPCYIDTKYQKICWEETGVYLTSNNFAIDTLKNLDDVRNQSPTAKIKQRI